MLTIPASLLAIIFLSLVALFHLLRLVFGVEVTADGRTIPVWLSLFGVVVPGALAWLLWRERQARREATHPRGSSTAGVPDASLEGRVGASSE